MSASSDLEHRFYLGIGSNIQPRRNLPRAINILREYVIVEDASSVYQSSSVGSVGPDFLNVVILICTTLTPEELKSKVINEIEITLGRERTTNKYAPRTIDIDILIVDEKLYDAELWKQAHMAVPLAELIPDYAHPVTGETLEHVAQQLAKRTPISAQSNVTGIISIRDD